MMKTVDLDQFKQALLSDPETKKAYDDLEEEFELSREIIQLRKLRNLTQKELAEEIGSSQPAIARLESGNYRNVSLSFLRRVAHALGAVTEIHLRKR